MLLLGTRDIIITATFSGMPGTEPEGGGGGEKRFLSAYAQGFTYTTFYVLVIIGLDKYHYYSHFAYDNTEAERLSYLFKVIQLINDGCGVLSTALPDSRGHASNCYTVLILPTR